MDSSELTRERNDFDAEELRQISGILTTLNQMPLGDTFVDNVPILRGDGSPIGKAVLLDGDYVYVPQVAL